VEVADVIGPRAPRTIFRRRTCAGNPAVAWSPRGDLIAVMTREQDQVTDTLDVMRPQGADAHRLAQFASSRITDEGPTWSPDGKQLALAGVPVKDEGTYKGRYNLYALDVAKGLLRKLAHEPDAVHPSWSPDGRLIAFTTQYGRLKDVDVQTRAIHTLADL